LLSCIRANDDYFDLEKEFDFFYNGNNTFISTISVGEIYSIAHQRNWQKRKKQRLKEVLDFFGKPLPITNKRIVEMYARIDAYSQGKLVGNPLPKGLSARNMGKNDVWIAATANVLDLHLVTMDKDFAHLKDTYCDLIIV
jgi:tRNA(fMet)-specific endonuclease VapC